MVKWVHGVWLSECMAYGWVCREMSQQTLSINSKCPHPVGDPIYPPGDHTVGFGRTRFRQHVLFAHGHLEPNMQVPMATPGVLESGVGRSLDHTHTCAGIGCRTVCSHCPRRLLWQRPWIWNKFWIRTLSWHTVGAFDGLWEWLHIIYVVEYSM